MEQNFKEQECSVCLERFNNPQEQGSFLPCGHWFDSACIASLPSEPEKVCPQCRKPIVIPGAVSVPQIGVNHLYPVQQGMFNFSFGFAPMPMSPPMPQCCMWKPPQPSKPARWCDMPAKKEAILRDQAGPSFFYCSLPGHGSGRDKLVVAFQAPSDKKCQHLIGARPATPARQCAARATNATTELCSAHCHDVLGRVVDTDYHANADDKQMIKAMIDSVRTTRSVR